MTCPIDKATMNNLRKAISVLQELERQIEMANQAGIDVSEDAARCQHLSEAAKAIVSVYGPMIYGPTTNGAQ